MKTLYCCINLKRRQDRRFVIEKTVHGIHGLNLHFIEAADGRRVSERRRKSLWISPSSYAVNLSKRITLREFLKTSAEAVVIFEDDVVLADDFNARWKRFLTIAPGDWGMLFLGGRHESPPEQTSITEVVKCTKTHFNHAWVVRRWCAKDIIQQLSRRPFVHMFSDQAIGAMQRIIPTYAPTKWMAAQRLSLSDNVGGVCGSKRWSPVHSSFPKLHADEISVIQSILQPGMKTLHIGVSEALFISATLTSPSGEIMFVTQDDEESNKVTPILHQYATSQKLKLLIVSASRTGQVKELIPSYPNFIKEEVFADQKFSQNCNFILINECNDAAVLQLAVKSLRSGGFFMIRGEINNSTCYRELLNEYLAKQILLKRIDGCQITPSFWLYERLPALNSDSVPPN